MKKMWRYLLAAVLAAVVLAAAACGKKALAGQEANQTVIPSWEGIFSRIDRGNIYEITENEFHQGIEYEFSQAELDCFKTVMEQKDYRCSQGLPKKEEIRFIIDLYDQNGSELAALSMDRNGKLYSDDGYLVVSSTLEEMLSGVIESQAE